MDQEKRALEASFQTFQKRLALLVARLDIQLAPPTAKRLARVLASHKLSKVRPRDLMVAHLFATEAVHILEDTPWLTEQQHSLQ